MKQFSAVLAILLTLCLTETLLGQCKDEACGLVVRGEVSELKVDRSDKNYVRFYATIDAEFINEGTETIILFKPEFDDGYWLGGRILSLTENGESIFGYGYWQSVSGDSSYRKLANKLDVKTPPKDLTVTLKPNESWRLKSGTDVNFSAEEERSTFPKKRSWKEMQEFPSKLWLTVSYEILPWNVEFFKKDLISKLQERWKKYGNILLERDSGRFNNFIISSSPMMIDFSVAKEK